MHKVEVTCTVYTKGSPRVEKIQTQCDDDTIYAAHGAKGEEGRERVGQWAKIFFPTSDRVVVTGIRKI
jgi:hypothetical protein